MILVLLIYVNVCCALRNELMMMMTMTMMMRWGGDEAKIRHPIFQANLLILVIYVNMYIDDNDDDYDDDDDNDERRRRGRNRDQTSQIPGKPIDVCNNEFDVKS